MHAPRQLRHQEHGEILGWWAVAAANAPNMPHSSISSSRRITQQTTCSSGGPHAAGQTATCSRGTRMGRMPHGHQALTVLQRKPDQGQSVAQVTAPAARAGVTYCPWPLFGNDSIYLLVKQKNIASRFFVGLLWAILPLARLRLCWGPSAAAAPNTQQQQWRQQLAPAAGRRSRQARPGVGWDTSGWLFSSRGRGS
jgi:hypothetical protein